MSNFLNQKSKDELGELEEFGLYYEHDGFNDSSLEKLEQEQSNMERAIYDEVVNKELGSYVVYGDDVAKIDRDMNIAHMNKFVFIPNEIINYTSSDKDFDIKFFIPLFACLYSGCDNGNMITISLNDIASWIGFTRTAIYHVKKMPYTITKGLQILKEMDYIKELDFEEGDSNATKHMYFFNKSKVTNEVSQNGRAAKIYMDELYKIFNKIPYENNNDEIQTSTRCELLLILIAARSYYRFDTFAGMGIEASFCHSRDLKERFYGLTPHKLKIRLNVLKDLGILFFTMAQTFKRQSGKIKVYPYYFANMYKRKDGVNVEDGEEYARKSISNLIKYNR